VVAQFSRERSLHQSYAEMLEQPRLAQDALWPLAIGQQVVQPIVEAVRFLLLTYHDAVSSNIGILDRLRKILISLRLKLSTR